MLLSKKKIMCLLGMLVFATCLVIFTNYSCLKKIIIQNNYKKNNGYELMVSLVSSFNEWNRKGDFSGERYDITLSRITEILDGDDINSDIVYAKIAEITKSNIFLAVDSQKNKGDERIMINQCIILPKIEVLYVTFNTIGWDRNKIIELSLIDQNGNVISSEPDFRLLREGLLIRNTENFFWGINIDDFKELILHVKILSESGSIDSEYVLKAAYVK